MCIRDRSWRAQKKNLPIVLLEASFDSLTIEVRREEINRVVVALQISQQSLGLTLNKDESLSLKMSIGGFQLDCSPQDESRLWSSVLKGSPHSKLSSVIELKVSTQPPASETTSVATVELWVGSLELVVLHCVLDEVKQFCQNSPLSYQVKRVRHSVVATKRQLAVEHAEKQARAHSEQGVTPQKGPLPKNKHDRATFLAQQEHVWQLEDAVLFAKEQAALEDLEDESRGFVNITVSVENPTVVLPRSSSSRDHATVQFKSLSVSNKLGTGEDGSEVDVVTLQMNDMSLSTNGRKGIKLEESDRAKLIQDTTMSVVLRRSMDDKKVRVDASVPHIALRASQDQVEVIVATIFENLAEQSQYALLSSDFNLVSSQQAQAPLQPEEGQIEDVSRIDIDLSVALSVERVSLEILQLDDQGKAASLAVLELGQADAQFHHKPGGELSARASMVSICLRDSRLDLGPSERQPIVLSKEDGQASLRVELKRAVAGDSVEADLFFSGLAVCLHQDTIRAWVEFAVAVMKRLRVMPLAMPRDEPASAKCGSSDDPSDSGPDSPVSTASSASNTTRAGWLGHMLLNAKLGRVSLELPTSAGDLLVLEVQRCTATVDIDDNVQTIDSQIVVSVYRATVHQPEVRVFDLLKPYELNIHSKKTPLSSNGWVQLLATEAFVSSQELALILTLREEFGPVLEMTHQLKRQRSQKLHRSASRKQAELVRANTTESDGSARKASRSQMFELVAESFLLTIVDKYLEPVLDVQLKQLRCVFQVPSPGTKEVALDFELDSCRHSLAGSAWEPVLEPATIRLALEMQKTILGAKSTFVDVTVPKDLNFVVCADLVKCLVELSDITPESAELQSTRAGCMLKIANQTCVDITVHSREGQSVSISSQEAGELALKSSVKSRHSAAGETSVSCIDVELGDGWGKLIGFDSSQAGQRVYSIANQTDGKIARVVLCIHLEARTRSLTVAVEVLLRNNSRLPVKARIAGNINEEHSLGVVQCGASIPLPFGAVTGQLQVLPQMCTVWEDVVDLSTASMSARDQDLTKASAELCQNFGEEIANEELLLATPPCQVSIGDKGGSVRVRLFFTRQKLFLHGNVFGRLTQHHVRFCDVQEMTGDPSSVQLVFTEKSGAPRL
eukprot:TRINITY_DN18039_c0_g1_i1.p1 TRINITY_DN18039_c0_g1~~TRINITY_DN18039_c0_g1_i1.p1  ORF type:complete len:1132 (-),score=213.66 TRINITY_DN18039_c0_g1_i1:3955-7350(-)